MKRLLAVFYIFIIALTSINAQDYGTHFLREVWQSNYTNPGLMPRQTVVIALPSVQFSTDVTGLNGDLFVLGGDDVYRPNFGGLVDDLDDDVVIGFNGGMDILNVGFKFKKFFFSIGTGLKMNGSMGMPADMINVAWNGTAPYLDQQLDLGPDINFQMYQELSLGVNYAFSRKLAVGARIKRLNGLVAFNTVRSGLNLTHSSDIYQMNVEADYAIDFVGTGFVNLPQGSVTGASDIGAYFADAVDSEFQRNLENGDPTGAFNALASNNTGIGLDLGIEANFKDRITLAASVLDIGSLNWQDGVDRLEITENFTFEGADFAGLALGNEGISVDTFSRLGTVTTRAGQGFIQQLPTKAYVSATVKVLPILRVGGLIFSQFGGLNEQTTLALNAQLKLGNFVQLGAVYAYKTGALDNVGVNAAVKVGPAQVYLVADNLYPILNPTQLERTNFRVGANLAFGMKKQRKWLKGKTDDDEEEESN